MKKFYFNIFVVIFWTPPKRDSRSIHRYLRRIKEVTDVKLRKVTELSSARPLIRRNFPDLLGFSEIHFFFVKRSCCQFRRRRYFGPDFPIQRIFVSLLGSSKIHFVFVKSSCCQFHLCLGPDCQKCYFFTWWNVGFAFQSGAINILKIDL